MSKPNDEQKQETQPDLNPLEQELEKLDKLDDGTALEAKEPQPDDEESKEPEQAEGEAEGEEEEKPSPDNRMIPRSRYNEKNEENKVLKARLAELEAAPAAPVAKEPNGKDDDVEAELRAELRKVSVLRKKAIERDDDDATADTEERIADIHAKLVQARMGGNTPLVDQDEVTAAAVDQMEWKQGLKDVYKEYPMLNANDAKNRDNALIEETLDMQSALRTRGQGLAESLSNAVHYVMGAAGIKPEGTEKKPSLDSEKKTRSTATKAAKKAPDISKAGDSGEEKELRLENISDDELAALPESRLKKMRGDYVE